MQNGDYDLPDLAATEAFAARVAESLGAHETLLLRGPLGVGKTSFARAFLRALGVEGEIPSPTFTLVQTYETATRAIAHFDLYRLEAPEEVEELGLDDAMAAGIVLIEWPERAERYMPRKRTELLFSIEGEGRKCFVRS